MPSDLILEQDALLITQHIDAMPEAEKLKAADVLKRYRVQQETAGSALFPTMAKQQAESREKLWSAFDDPKTLDKENGVYAEADRLEAGLGDNLRASELQARFLSHRYGQPLQKVRDEVEHFATQYSQKTWGEAVTDPAQFFAKAKADVTKERDEFDMNNEAFREATLAAMDGANLPLSLAKWQEQAVKKPGFSAGQSSLYMERYNTIARTLEKHRPAIDGYMEATQRTMQGRAGETDAATMAAFRETLLDMPTNEQDLAMSAIAAKALKLGKTGEAKNGIRGFFQETGESFGRFVAGDTIAVENALSMVLESPGRITTSIKAIETPEQARAFVKEQASQNMAQNYAAVSSSGTAGVPRIALAGPERELTSDEAKLVRAAKEREQKGIDLDRKIKRIAEQTDPVTGAVSGTLGPSLGIMAAMLATRGAALPVIAQTYASNNYNDIRLDNPDIEPQKARQIALASGAAEAALDLWDIKILTKLPTVASLLKNGLKREALTSAARNVGGAYFDENIQEASQDLVLPLLKTAMASDAPSVDFEQDLRAFAQSRGDVALAILPLVLIGGGVATARDYLDFANIEKTNQQLGEAGFIESDRVTILDAMKTGSAEVVDAAIVDASPRRMVEVAAEWQDKAGEKAQADMQATAAAQELFDRQGYTLRRDGEGWSLRTPDGATVKTATAEEAVGLLQQDFNEGQLRNAQAVADMADVFLSQKRGGERIEVQPGQSRDIRDDVAEGNITPEQAREAIVTAGKLAGLSEEESMQQIGAVLGSSTIEENEGVREAVSRIYKGGDAMTVVEETIEGRWKKGLKDGRYTPEQGAGWVRLAEQATGESYLPESHSDRDLVEAISYIIKADVMGRARDGSRLAPGVVSRGLVAARKMGAAEAKEAGKFKAFLDSWREWAKRVFGTARKLSKARAEGKLDADFETLLDDLLGIDAQTRHEAGAVKIAEDWVNGDAMTYTPADGETFSLGRAIPADARNVVQMPDGARLVGPTTFSLTAYHATPHKVEKFRLDKIGTGEGAQAFGWGLYYAESESISGRGGFYDKAFQEKLSRSPSLIINGAKFNGEDTSKFEKKYRIIIDLWRAPNKPSEKQLRDDLSKLAGLPAAQDALAMLDSGEVSVDVPIVNIYTVELLPDEGDFLDWDKPLSEQSEKVRDELFVEFGSLYDESKTGGEWYQGLTKDDTDPKTLSEDLARIGIPGIRYLDGGSRGAGDGTRNYVIFDEKLVRILEENGKPVNETFSLGRITPKQDADYMAAVEASDMETAWSMVLATVKKEGLSDLLFHGTDSEFTEFDPKKAGSRTRGPKANLAFWFTESENHSLERGAISMPVFLKYDNPLTISDLTDTFTAGNIVESAKNSGHDAVIFEKLDDLDGSSDGVYSVALIVNDKIAAQIKSAEPVTRNEKDEVIPLSRRFDKGPDIRGDVYFDSSAPAFGAETFSLARRNLAAFAETKMLKMMEKPEFKEAMIRVAAAKVAEIRKDQAVGYPALAGFKDGKPVYERRETIREGMDKQAAATRTEASLKQEAKFQRQLRERELIEEGMGELTSATILTYERGVEALKDDPFIAAMLAKGTLMSRTTAEKAGKLKTDGTGVAGDYNGAPLLPPSFYGGKIMPTEMADALYKEGALKDAYPDTLWDKLNEVINSRRKDNEAFNKARDAVREVEKKAKEQAAKESEKWLQDARAKVPTEKERQMQALRLLDAILSAFPVEIRGRVGGFYQLAKKDTDKAREAEIGRRLDKLDVELEKFAKKHFAAKLEKLLEKNRSERSKRGVFEGRTIATVTEQVTYAADFSDLSKEAQDKEIAHLETIIANPDSTREETSNAINKLGAAELFYNLKGKDSRTAEALEQAHDWLNDLVTMGRDTRKILDEERKAYLDDLRKAGVTSILGNPNASQTDAENVMQKINGSTLRKALEMVKGFINSVLPTTAQQLEDVFSQGSAVPEAFIPQIYGAANRSNDIKRSVEASRRSMMGRVFKTSSTIKQIIALTKLQQSRKSGVFILDGRKTEDVTVPVEIMERLVDGTMTAKAAGLSEDEARMVMDQWAETEGEKRSGTIERVTNPGTMKELDMSEMQALNYLLHWNQDEVRERMERHGWTEESMTQLQAFLSPESKAIGEWMSEQYRVAGRALVEPVYRRLYHAPLPFVKNFAPTFYDRAGNDSTLGLDAAQNSSGMMASFTKGRRAHNNNVRRMDAMTVFLSHFEHVSHWVSFVELLRDMKAVLGSTEVQNATIATYGPSAASAMSTRMKAIESQGNDAAWALHDLNGFFGRMNQARAFKGLAYRVSPIVKQTSAFLNPLLADVPASAYAAGLGKLLSGKLDVSAMWNSPTIQRRIEGGFSPEARLAMQASGDGPIAAVAIKLMQNGMMPMQYTDAAWTAAGAAIAFDYYRGLAVKAGEANPEASALRSVERMIATSAQPADLVNRSLVEASSNPFLKSVWMFASESRKTLAVEYYAAKRLATGKSASKALDVQRILTAHFIMGAVTQLMSGLLASTLGSDDDEEREWSAEEWATALIAGPVNGLFVLGDGLNTFIRLALGLKVFRSTSPFGQAIEEAGKAVSNFDDLWSGDADKAKAELDRLSSSAGTILSGFFGPAAQAPDVILGNPIRQISKALDED